METVDRFLTDFQGSAFLFGPRGTGKSTWVKATFPKALHLDLLHLDRFRELQARPELLVELIHGHQGPPVVVIDEVQKLPDLLSTVHSLMEDRTDLRFVMTGSSARKIRRVGVNLLAGRAILETMHPFMAAELGERFRLDRALRRGLVPLVLGAKNPDTTLRSYAALYLKEEVQAEGLVRNLSGFARFLEAISFSHGSPLNIANVARDCQVERKVVEGYVSVLEDLLLGWRLPVFRRRAKRVTTTHPKFYYFDAGVFRSLRPAGPLDQPAEIDGAALEGLVLQHLRAWNAYGGHRHELSFWRTRAGTEVDFIVYGPDTFWAIEVKNAARLRPQDLRSLRTFCSEYPESRGLLLYRGADHLRRHNVLCLPVENFLKGLHPQRTLEEVLYSE